MGYDEKSMRLAKRRAMEKREEFRGRYRFRAGIEGSISEFDRRTGVKKLRVRGKKAVGFCVYLKETGLNILRAAAYRLKKWGEGGIVPDIMVELATKVLDWRKMWARLKERFRFESQDAVLVTWNHR